MEERLPARVRTQISPPRLRWALWLIVLACLATTGCATGLREWAHNRFKVGPNYQRPPAPVSPAYIDADNHKIACDPVQDCMWWTVFDDPTLNGLIETAYRQNLDLRVAGTRILEARGQRNIAVGNLFPQSQSAMGAYAHGQITENLNVPVPNSFNILATGFNASWELDFWGRYRRSIESANASWQSSVEQYGETLVMLLSEVATTYVQLRTFEERLDFARHNVTIQAGSLKIAESRFSEGVATELDVRQARTSLAQTESAIPPLEAGWRQASNRLCVLLGMPVNQLADQFPPAPIPHAPPQLAVGVPADLLRRRPDVRRAEREVAAQSAQIGIAESDLYPRFSVNGFLGYAADDIERLFNAKSFTAFVVPQFQWNVLNYGRIANNIAVQDVRLEGVALQYQQTVLQAGQEVEDSLIGFIKSQQQAAKLEQSVRDAERSVELVLIQFKGGVVDFNRVYNTQSALVSQQDQLAVSRGQIALNLIQAYKALGGGWRHFFAGRGLPPVSATLPVQPMQIEELPPVAPAAPQPMPEVVEPQAQSREVGPKEPTDPQK
jgi:NodT family efflux transporter outer membrane factor (OMF) lipoprotein